MPRAGSRPMLARTGPALTRGRLEPARTRPTLARTVLALVCRARPALARPAVVCCARPALARARPVLVCCTPPAVARARPVLASRDVTDRVPDRVTDGLGDAAQSRGVGHCHQGGDQPFRLLPRRTRHRTHPA
ncbi:hypothetical protein ODJ79_18260 [Actinoplanes sp. KI2]|uniref:hypothetical protein n=1 Tax=Actinoplanes sp. KI2 TaxID=2983315 RepID=UPI0021D574E8|nr:hypothetical protein [Actinoplanes sp. KI2]MCU7725677.1 hypothetical protein [Actinoplanes sp. KI2]